jgi:hypothetical protein
MLELLLSELPVHDLGNGSKKHGTRLALVSLRVNHQWQPIHSASDPAGQDTNSQKSPSWALAGYYHLLEHRRCACNFGLSLLGFVNLQRDKSALDEKRSGDGILKTDDSMDKENLDFRHAN